METGHRRARFWTRRTLEPGDFQWAQTVSRQPVSRYRLDYVGEGGSASELWIGSFSTVKARAIEIVDLGRATRAEVRDDVDRLIFRYPKIEMDDNPEV